MTQPERTKLTFQIVCDDCSELVYEKGIDTLAGAIVCMMEKLSDVNKSIQSHKMICSGKDDSKLRNRLR